MSHRLLPISFLFCLPFLGAAQNPHPYFRNYTTDHGLPSSEVHYCLEGPRGYFWFATDNGLSRFDGYRFKNYGPKEGLTDPVIFYMAFDQKGRLWMATLSGQLFILENDRIRPFEKNDFIREQMGRRFISDFFIDSNGDKCIKLQIKGWLKFSEEGEVAAINKQNHLGGAFLYRFESRWAHGETDCPDSLRGEVNQEFFQKNIFPPLEIQNGGMRLAKGETMNDHEGVTGNWAKEFMGGELILFMLPGLYQIDDDSIILRQHINYTSERKGVWQRADSSIWLGLKKSGGLRKYKNMDTWQEEDFDHLLLGKTISHLFEDSRAGLWVSTVEHGVFHCPDPDRKIFDVSSGLSTDYVSAIAFGEANEMFVGLRNGDIYRLDMVTDQFSKLPKAPFEPIVYDLAYAPAQKQLWTVTGYLSFFDNGEWEQAKNINLITQTYSNPINKSISLKKGSTQLWGGGSAGFGMIDIETKEMKIDAYPLGLFGRILTTLEANDGSIWLGRLDGLHEFRDGQLFRPQLLHPELQARVDDLAELPDGTLVMATKGEGLLFLRDTFFRKITSDDGLITNMLENVHVDEKGRIWVGSLQGLSRVTLAEKVDNPPEIRRVVNFKPTIENFTTWHGLPSNEITMVRSRGNEVWVATTRGLMQWREPTKNTSTTPPFFEKMEVNGEGRPLSKGEFRHHENNLTFHYLTINFGQAGRIPYRHRLNGGAWNHTEERRASFANLAPGAYRFEVQSQNEDGVWSESLVREFAVRPPWWQRWWFYLLLAALASAAVFVFYKYRTGILKNEIDLQKQVADLEKKALQAQMNPHFIFNCLTSIQKLILEKDADNAVRYLTRFSKLVRTTLSASVRGKVTLEEEIVMLTNYLELEKLRFKQAFDYHIEAAPSLDQYEAAFPPMLLQPYVENAVKHGMAGKENGGLIHIGFRPAANGDGLLATITDNGPGIGQSNKLRPGHPSMGMSLTQRRLELLAKTDGRQVEVTEIKNAEGEVAGTRVEVRIG